MTPDETTMIRKELKQINEAIARLQTLIETEAQRCPYREEISRASNNHHRLQRVESDIDELQKAAAISGAMGGGAAGLVAAVVVGIGKVLGWW